jgi:hypothetical protein
MLAPPYRPEHYTNREWMTHLEASLPDSNIELAHAMLLQLLSAQVD